MKKIMKLLAVFLIGIVSVFSSSMQVKAQTYGGRIKAGNYITGYYKVVHQKGSYKSFHDAQMLIRTSDGAFVYCVQPLVIVNSDATYQVTTEDIAQVLSIPQSTWSEISKIAYYGYGYSDPTHDHSADKWWAATQMLIWQKVDPTVDSYFSNTAGGPKDDSVLRSEMNEIMDLVNKHLIKPNFTGMPSEMIIGQSVTLTDTNGVLNNYNIANVKGGTVSKNGNNLTITATEVGEISFDIQKLGNRYGNAIELYYATDSQDVFHRGNIDPITMNSKVKVYGGTVTINKTDEENLSQTPQGEATLEGATYGVYKEDGTKVGTITTDKDGNATSDYLPSLGRFYVLEEKASTGYEIDKNKYFFNITKDDLYPTVQVFEKVIKTKFEYTKVYANAKTGVMEPEKNVKFDIYNNKNEVVRTVTTDDNGIISFSLPYGTYTLKQVTSTPGYEKVKDMTLKVTKTGIEKDVLANAPITAKLKVVKIDSETKKVIKRAGIKFKIFSVDNNEYVCQKITYPTNKTICEWETDENGEFITAYPLMPGKYKLEEIDQKIDGYLWNKTSQEFEIGENVKLVEDEDLGIIFDTDFGNTPVKGEIQVKKNGEVFVAEEGEFKYIFKPLKGVTYELYSNEDIKDSEGNVTIKKDTLIDSKVTDDNGNLSFKNLHLGKYYLKETKTLDNYVLDTNKYEVEVTYKDQYTPVVVNTKSIKNYLKKGDLEFTKTDLVEGKVIPNTKVEIYTENDELIFTGITDDEGKITIKDLTVGKYYIIETEAATGYKITDEKVLFEIKDNGEVVKAKMTNKKINGGLEFSKVDFSTSEPLPNTTIEIYNDKDELIFTGITDEEGKIVIEELEYGKYYILEKNAPEGYQLNPEKMYFEILEDGEIVKCTMTDEKVIVEVPNTDSSNYIIQISLILMGLATGVVVYEEIKKRKRK